MSSASPSVKPLAMLCAVRTLMITLSRWSCRGCLALAASGVAALSALVIWTVFMRWVMGQPPHWAEELPQLVLVWTTLLAAVSCTRNRTHLSAGLLPLLVRSMRIQRITGRITDAMILIMLLLLAKAGMDLTVITMRQTTTALQIPAGIVYLSVPLCCTAMALVQLEHLLTPTATSRDTLADDAPSSPRQGDAS
ncbi:TRAP transporter small permease [Cobetia sp. MC34]|jgi:TRAP-type C4-dicarboxylate transport system permease small subunit|uniref:TRAP transporter small permease n=2 Tax=unclassified Cobetia TaxID=2609414 RepID=UPI0020164818|nr:TRAP transporter small permease [Cobetia sp. MC34]|tara:strand:- start:345 stop:926 length:582 start_codon:yes stop_codon:yes gene_type:complete